jgi:hypothetical protein
MAGMLTQASWPGAGTGSWGVAGRTGAALVVGGTAGFAGVDVGLVADAVVDTVVVAVVAGAEDEAERKRTGRHPAGTVTVVVVGVADRESMRGAALAWPGELMVRNSDPATTHAAAG